MRALTIVILSWPDSMRCGRDLRQRDIARIAQPLVDLVADAADDRDGLLTGRAADTGEQRLQFGGNGAARG